MILKLENNRSNLGNTENIIIGKQQVNKILLHHNRNNNKNNESHHHHHHHSSKNKNKNKNNKNLIVSHWRLRATLIEIHVGLINENVLFSKFRVELGLDLRLAID